MTEHPPRSLEDDADESPSPQQTLEDLAGELTGEPPTSVSEEEDEERRLTEEEIESAAGVQSPPGRID
jgi:hypothetical protein